MARPKRFRTPDPQIRSLRLCEACEWSRLLGHLGSEMFLHRLMMSVVKFVIAPRAVDSETKFSERRSAAAGICDRVGAGGRAPMGRTASEPPLRGREMWRPRVRVGKPCDLRPFICADAPDFPAAQPALRLRSSCLIVQPRRDFGSQAYPFHLRAMTRRALGDTPRPPQS